MNRAVVYYSLSGNTKEAAKVIARKLGAKIFEIDLVTVSYTHLRAHET